MTTNRQKNAVHFCEEWLDVEFEGDINNFSQVSNFLAMYLADAKMTAMELTAEYLADRGY